MHMLMHGFCASAGIVSESNQHTVERSKKCMGQRPDRFGRFILSEQNVELSKIRRSEALSFSTMSAESEPSSMKRVIMRKY